LYEEGERMGDTKYCLNCKQYVKPIRNYKNIRGRQGIGTYMLGKLKPERCPKCMDTNFSKVAPAPEPIQVRETKEVITREVVMIPCQYCKSLMPQTSLFCPNCGASHKS
jgi:RNA polymerase subunit RPABC4/transcription elongation factor Spt4